MQSVCVCAGDYYSLSFIFTSPFLSNSLIDSVKFCHERASIRYPGLWYALAEPSQSQLVSVLVGLDEGEEYGSMTPKHIHPPSNKPPWHDNSTNGLDFKGGFLNRVGQCKQERIKKNK